MTDRSLRVLIATGDDGRAALLGAAADAAGADRVRVGAGEEALERMRSGRFDVVWVDLAMPGARGVNTLTAGRAFQPDAAFLAVAPVGDVSAAVEAMRQGARDCVTLPLDEERAMALTRRMLAQQRPRSRAGEPPSGGSDPLEAIAGVSAARERVVALLERVATSPAPVLFTGEPGVGKKHCARVLHRISGRSEGPLVAIDLQGVPEEALASELFGVRRGALPGATADHEGRLLDADGGTVLLEGIERMGRRAQGGLLRLLEEGVVVPVGGGEGRSLDVRVLATATDLAEALEAGRFRRDLYRRLGVVETHLPPLRERPEDVPPLADHLLARLAEPYEGEPPSISSTTMARMLEYEWPGNVRELEGFLERSLALFAGGDVIELGPAAFGDGADGGRLVDRGRREGWSLDRLEREYLLSVLEEVDGNRSRAADVLGVTRSTVYRKLEKYAEQGVEVG